MPSMKDKEEGKERMEEGSVGTYLSIIGLRKEKGLFFLDPAVILYNSFQILQIVIWKSYLSYTKKIDNGSTPVTTARE